MYWYGGLLNYLIPSGGGEWAVVAPYMIPAAKQLGLGMGPRLSPSHGATADRHDSAVLAIAMLAVAKLHFRDIMGWLLMVFFVYSSSPPSPSFSSSELVGQTVSLFPGL